MPVRLTVFMIIVRLLAKKGSKGGNVVQMKTYLTLVGAFHSPQPWASPCLPSGRYCPNLTHPLIPTTTGFNHHVGKKIAKCKSFQVEHTIFI